MFDTDFKFWMQEIAKWQEMAQTYLDLDDMAGFERCMARIGTQELYLSEAKGEIVVYTGRKSAKYTFGGILPVHGKGAV